MIYTQMYIFSKKAASVLNNRTPYGTSDVVRLLIGVYMVSKGGFRLESGKLKILLYRSIFSLLLLIIIIYSMNFKFIYKVRKNWVIRMIRVSGRAP